MAVDWEADRKVLSRVQDSKLWNRDGPNLGVHKQICKICVQGIEYNWYTISILCSSFSLKFKCGLWKQKIQITNFVPSSKHKVMLYNLGLLFKYLHNWNQPSHIHIPKRRLESTNDFRGTVSKTKAFLNWIPGLQLLVPIRCEDQRRPAKSWYIIYVGLLASMWDLAQDELSKERIENTKE